MGKSIFFAIMITSICVGQSEKLKYNSKFALGLISGLNYAFYVGDRWPEKTSSAPSINIGIDLKFKAISELCVGQNGVKSLHSTSILTDIENRI